MFRGPYAYFRIMLKRDNFIFRVFKLKIRRPSDSVFLCKWGTDIRHLFTGLKSDVWSWV